MGGSALGRVSKRAEFQAFRKPLGRGRSGPLAVSFAARPERDPEIALAFAISKRCGGAVQRNLIRRRLRSAVQSLEVSVAPGMYLVRTEPEALNLTFEELIHNLGRAMARASQSDKEKHG